MELERPGISLRCRSSPRTREELKILGGKEAILKRNLIVWRMAKAAKSKGIRALNAGVFVDVFENRAMYVATLVNIVLLLLGDEM